MDIVIFTVFVIGHLLHVGLQIDAVCRSKANPINSRWLIVHQNAFRIAARFFVSLMVFLFIWQSPDAVPAVLGYLGITLSPNAVSLMTLPMNAPIAGVMGFAIDTLLTYVPWMKNQLPPIEFTVDETAKIETAKEIAAGNQKPESGSDHTPPPPPVSH